MRKQLSIALIALLCGCGTSTSTDKAAAVAGRTVKEVTITEGQPVATADLGITGMTCEQMCGGMIKGALTKLPGVAGTEIAFKDGDEVGHAKVTYDPAKVDDAQLVQAVQDLADGQYKVISLAIVKEVKNSPSASKKLEGKDDEVSASLLPEVTMPNLVSTLMALVRI
jgi:copper chaperone CopZ